MNFTTVMHLSLIHIYNKEVKPSNLSMYIRQNPNAKWFSLIKTQLYVYNRCV